MVTQERFEGLADTSMGHLLAAVAANHDQVIAMLFGVASDSRGGAVGDDRLGGDLPTVLGLTLDPGQPARQVLLLGLGGAGPLFGRLGMS